MCEQEQLRTTILYLTSSATQIWATIMVFNVLLVRDRNKEIEDEFSRMYGLDVRMGTQTNSILFSRVKLLSVAHDHISFNCV